MMNSLQLEVLDLRHFSAADLRPLLMDQAARWHRLLHWDYSASTKLLLEYIDGRVLPGFAAVQRGRVIGYAFSVMEAAKAVIGDVYAYNETERLDNPVCERLLGHLLEMLQAAPDVDRIEAQLMMFPPGALNRPMRTQGFQAYPRLYMQWDLARSPVSAFSQATLPTGLRLLAWQPEFYESAAELIHRAYLGHVDSNINDQYRDVQGSLRFLHNVIRFPGCGVFHAENSWALRDNATGKLHGLLLSSRIRNDVGHVTQLCVDSELHGLGLGKLLLTQCAREFAKNGGSAVSLTVTEANAPALRLYHELGFRTLQRFEAMVWNKGK